jgi:hypothetical protein
VLSEVMKVYKTYPCGVTLLAQKEGKKCTKSTQKAFLGEVVAPKNGKFMAICRILVF